MTIGKRIWLSILIGWGIKLIPLLIAYLFENKVTGIVAGIANIDAVIGWALAGKGPELPGGGREGTPIHLLFGIIGFLSGFIICPLITFAILTLVNKFNLIRNGKLL